mmetsp:Transcript_9195/g.16074  ORF Transcript_9195/g.16074 Transcript_9195/m.16074 type:complete len:424 (+) Transcript_9195:337-1608(+)
MSASAIFFTDLKGKILISRNYRGDVPVSCIERFATRIQEEEEADMKPVFTEQDVTFVYIKYNNLYVLSVTKKNANVFTMMNYMVRLCGVLKGYFGEVSEESIRDNFVIIYELLDETMDFGFPQTTEEKILREYITQSSFRLEKQPRPPMALTNAVSWRSEGIVHRKNEVFLDVIEELNLLVSASGQVLHSEILGKIKMKSFLSGMPELKLGLNDKLMFKASGRSYSKGKAVELEDVKFHQCVRLARFENDRTISFIPPDGEFELMSYRITNSISLPFRLIPVVEELGKTKVLYNIRLISQVPADESAQNIMVCIPCPPNTANSKPHVTKGRARYDPTQHAIIWRLRKFVGKSEATFTCAVETIPSTKEKAWSRPPIQMDFAVPMWAASGLKVRYLKVVEKSGYKTKNFVKLFTKASDSYQIRI